MPSRTGPLALGRREAKKQSSKEKEEQPTSALFIFPLLLGLFASLRPIRAATGRNGPGLQLPRATVYVPSRAVLIPRAGVSSNRERVLLNRAGVSLPRAGVL